MPTEIIRITLQPGLRDQFVAKIGEVGPAYLASPGVQSARFFSQVDDENTVLGVLEWESKDALDAAMASPAGEAFLGAVGPLMAGAPDLRLGEPL